MLDLQNNSEVTESIETLSVAGWSQLPPSKALPRHIPTHWSRHLPDPLGAALNKLRRTRTTLDDVAAAADSWGQSPPPSAATPASLLVEQADLPTATTDPGSHPELPAAAESELPIAIPAVDRRRFPRRSSECLVTVVERSATAELTPREVDWMLQSSRDAGRLLDLSQTGLCLLLDHDLAIDSEVLLRISNPQLDRYVDASAKVVRSYRTGQGRYSIHCQALNDFTLDELQDLGRPVVVNHVLG